MSAPAGRRGIRSVSPQAQRRRARADALPRAPRGLRLRHLGRAALGPGGGFHNRAAGSASSHLLRSVNRPRGRLHFARLPSGAPRHLGSGPARGHPRGRGLRPHDTWRARLTWTPGPGHPRPSRPMGERRAGSHAEKGPERRLRGATRLRASSGLKSDRESGRVPGPRRGAG